MKKVYFACSIAGGRDQAHVYKHIVQFIKAAGAQTLSEIFVDTSLEANVGTNPDLTPQAIWQRDTGWVSEADAIVAEVTQPSLGVGYEIAVAEAHDKPILALFYKDSGRRLSPMVAGNPKVKVFEYSEISEAKTAITNFISKL